MLVVVSSRGPNINCEFEPGKEVNSKYLDSSDVNSDDEEGDCEIEEEKKNKKFEEAVYWN